MTFKNDAIQPCGRSAIFCNTISNVLCRNVRRKLISELSSAPTTTAGPETENFTLAGYPRMRNGFQNTRVFRNRLEKIIVLLAVGLNMMRRKNEKLEMRLS